MTERVKVAPEQTFNFEGAKLNYRIVGQGSPVVLLHGSMVADLWNGFEKQLGKYYRVYLPELPGFGASEAVEGKIHNMELFARAFAAFVKRAGLESVPIIAFSLGTTVAIKAAGQGEIGGRLILVGMPVRLESKLLERIMQMPVPARRILAKSELARGGILLSILKDVIGTADSGFAIQYLKLLRTSDVRAMVDVDPITDVEKDMPWYLGRLKNRMDFIYGEKDKLRDGAEKFLGRKIRIVAGAGHDIFVSKPKDSLNLLREMLDEQSSRWERVKQWWLRPI
jgi:pimeloyl-ACP methyl ester carboxylesterase